VDNRILPLPERSRNQTPHGIGQLPEQTLRNTSHIGDDRRADYFRAAIWINREGRGGILDQVGRRRPWRPDAKRDQLELLLIGADAEPKVGHYDAETDQHDDDQHILGSVTHR
jgi:hypothetical protein